MYVCICNAIRESDLRNEGRRCSRAADEIYAALGRPPLCGQCLEDAEEILHQERTANKSAKLTACAVN